MQTGKRILLRYADQPQSRFWLAGGLSPKICRCQNRRDFKIFEGADPRAPQPGCSLMSGECPEPDSQKPKLPGTRLRITQKSQRVSAFSQTWPRDCTCSL